MSTLEKNLGTARKRVEALTELTRWLWCINALVALVGVALKHYELAGLAAFTSLVALVAAALGRRAAFLIPDSRQRPPELR